MSPAKATKPKVKKSKVDSGVKNCPFCGARARVRRLKPIPPEIPTPWYLVGCCRFNNCVIWPEAVGDSRDEAIAKWNTRA